MLVQFCFSARLAIPLCSSPTKQLSPTGAPIHVFKQDRRDRSSRSSIIQCDVKVAHSGMSVPLPAISFRQTTGRGSFSFLFSGLFCQFLDILFNAQWTMHFFLFNNFICSTSTSQHRHHAIRPLTNLLRTGDHGHSRHPIWCITHNLKE